MLPIIAYPDSKASETFLPSLLFFFLVEFAYSTNRLTNIFLKKMRTLSHSERRKLKQERVLKKA